ncbi:MAG: Rieske (2Fe-2S) protein [Pirellula sp.]|jgi:nitrite reductase (NADH) small subunit
MAWQEVLRSEELVEGQGVEVLHEGAVIAVFRHRGLLYAVDGVCMHQGGPLARGKLSEGTVVCPWHGWMYELSTGKNAVTCQKMLNTYLVRERDGKIEIDASS